MTKGIQRFWIVRDPGPDSTLVDILADADAAGLARIILGTGLDVWLAERTAIYADAAEAERDAAERMSAYLWARQRSDGERPIWWCWDET